MKKLCWVSGLLCLAMSAGVWAEPMRTVLTKENRFPYERQVEGSAWGVYKDFDAYDYYAVTPMARYGLFDHLAVWGALPLAMTDDDNGDEHFSMDDLTVGFELLAWEDYLTYPWIIPHAQVSLPTGNEDEHMGRGEVITTFGLAVGTVVDDRWHFILDARYAIGGDNKTYKDDVASLAGAVLFEVSDIFSAHGEVEVSDDDLNGQDKPVRILGGMTYEPADDWSIGVYGGGVKNRDENVDALIRVTHTF